ncbi:MAG: hypothetical protein ABI380_07750 [Edaphobacter sp.]|jgi:hypothetical protein
MVLISLKKSLTGRPPFRPRAAFKPAVVIPLPIGQLRMRASKEELQQKLEEWIEEQAAGGDQRPLKGGRVHRYLRSQQNYQACAAVGFPLPVEIR